MTCRKPSADSAVKLKETAFLLEPRNGILCLQAARFHTETTALQLEVKYYHQGHWCLAFQYTYTLQYEDLKGQGVGVHGAKQGMMCLLKCWSVFESNTQACMHHERVCQWDTCRHFWEEGVDYEAALIVIVVLSFEVFFVHRARTAAFGSAAC